MKLARLGVQLDQLISNNFETISGGLHFPIQ